MKAALCRRELFAAYNKQKGTLKGQNCNLIRSLANRHIEQRMWRFCPLCVNMLRHQLALNSLPLQTWKQRPKLCAVTCSNPVITGPSVPSKTIIGTTCLFVFSVFSSHKLHHVFYDIHTIHLWTSSRAVKKDEKCRQFSVDYICLAQ